LADTDKTLEDLLVFSELFQNNYNKIQLVLSNLHKELKREGQRDKLFIDTILNTMRK
jgi:hypothetical protein